MNKRDPYPKRTPIYIAGAHVGTIRETSKSNVWWATNKHSGWAASYAEAFEAVMYYREQESAEYEQT